MSRTLLIIFFFIPFISGDAFGGIKERSLPDCGSIYAPPFANSSDAGRRACPSAGLRNYTPKHKGIGFQILDLESEACFVPDDSYRLLDSIVDDVLTQLPKVKTQTNKNAKISQVLAVSTVAGDVLAQKGFGLYIPTETLGDALTFRNAPGENPRHVFDCDTGSIMLLTIAEALSLQASLVEITLPSGSGHNYVRWSVGENTSVEWDTNGRAQCMTPTNIPSFQGKSMTRAEVMSFALMLRAPLWQRQGLIGRAVDDYREAAKARPDHPAPLNNFAWLIASTDFPDRKNYIREAMEAANKATSIQRIPNFLDTLACMHALVGDFTQAAIFEKEVVAAQPSNKAFAERLKQFLSSNPRDCTGAE